MSEKDLTSNPSLGVVDNDTCVLCQSGQDSISHFFFPCQYSSYLWSLSKLKLGLTGAIGTLHEEAILIQKKFRGKTKSYALARLAIAAVVWHIWKKRNMRTFQLQQQHKIVVFRRLYEAIWVLLRTSHWKSESNEDSKMILSNWNVLSDIP